MNKSFNSFPALFAFFAITQFAGWAIAQDSRNLTSNDNTEGQQGFAVVELFTSQGCSSCPPADKLLTEIAAKAEREKSQVYVLSYHVDYWNYLGWTDPFSDSKYTKRQREYADQFRSRQIYTPQMVVNGTVGFVGSKTETAHNQIRLALKNKPVVSITIESSAPSDDDSISVSCECSGSWKNKVLNLALVTDPAKISVKRGENAGRQLQHVNVVYALHTFEIENPKSTVKITIPEHVKSNQVRVIGFVQDKKTMAITGASTTVVPKK